MAKQLGQTITAEWLRDVVSESVAEVIKLGMESPDDIEQLIKDLEAETNIVIGEGNALTDDSDHEPWLADRLAEKASWKFWDRYSRYAKGELGLPSIAVTRMDEVTDDILGRLENPNREGPWDRRGLVAGQVQSGKTGNYTALIAKALDCGYKLIVVLAGIHNSLRSQTQSRVDEGILGFDTRAFRKAIQADDASRVGVGKLSGPKLYVSSFTSSDDKGDFSLQVAQNMGVVPGGSDPIILVVKKNKSILENLYRWATLLNKERDPDTGKFKVKGVSVLVIDDEADHASINTRHSKDGEDETDPSAINGLIRQFLDTFDRTAYVAYTATPFANIFIDPDGQHSEKGEDLFPRSFIVNLPPPSNYIGPERVFGLREDVANAIDEVKPLPIVRSASDYEAWIPDKHKSSHLITEELPHSLKDAIVLFLMAGAVRRLRGQTKKHHSMLIHVTRFTEVQKQVASQVAEFLREVRQRLEYGEGGGPWLKPQAQRLFTDDLIPTTADLSQEPDLDTLIGVMPPFDDIWDELVAAATSTRVHLVNGTSSDALEYIDHPDGVSVIAIGGDKLSRGLTLEGLCVSYYLRASKMYDTLMQMGRWFGYRPRYLDLCRLYTADNLINWYERITAASAELQREFEAMAIVEKTPEQFGLRVRQLPDGLLVTSPAKLKHAQKISISFSGTLSETVTFRNAYRASNFAALDSLIERLGKENENRTGLLIWRQVSPDDVLAFFAGYTADRAAFRVQPKALSDYINARVADAELVDWTVVLADSSQGTTTVRIGGRDIRQTKRQDLRRSKNESSGGGQDKDRYTVRRIVSPPHELVDVQRDSPRWSTLLEQTREAAALNPARKPDAPLPSVPSGMWERRSRSPKQGLLILYPLLASEWSGIEGDEPPFVGFAASFPWSERAKPLDYQVNTVLLKSEFGWDDEDLDDE
ncbi:hypothetical protein FHT40_005015 [Mycolicibacterium sp. BK556]|uniref:Z1 domain-containing protein n=1 Tax=unclassified Mycolicibacterium TaxID=2636767 RepID=UPI0016097146|nr:MULTISPECIES: Z1 domain-containing protein [unclassified Mycolicibacterium]MBB3605331.1 hypothetical protein [Mycolicibacterium sp. BK556]MBB3635527.1 hypothetical protein [Mycolicibacterium sp. BK607]